MIVYYVLILCVIWKDKTLGILSFLMFLFPSFVQEKLYLVID